MRRILSWLLVPLLPVATVLALLALQDPPAPPRAIAPVEALPSGPEPPPLREFALAIRRADGAPAADAVAIVAAPEVARAEVGDDGVARFALRIPGAVSLLAWAPGHLVRESGPWEAPPAELRLDPLPETAPSVAPLALAPLRLRLLDGGGAPLADALLLVRDADEPEAPPWLAFSDADGLAACAAGAGKLRLEVFAPGRAPDAEWSLGARDLGDDSREFDWALATARLELRGLPALEAVHLRRDGRSLDLRAAGEDGTLVWPCLPPGGWELSAAGGAMQLHLAPGANAAEWAPGTGG